MNYSPTNMKMWSRLGPSGAFGAAAMELGEICNEAVIVSADMSFAGGIDRFRNKYPDKHYEVGIAEQNLVGVSSGLASEGFRPFAVTYATFFATRALDQIKMCLGYMNQNVKLVGLNGGFATGILGATHIALEDLAIMRSIPGMVVISPADATEIVKAILAASSTDSPTYIRFTGEMNLPQIYCDDYEFIIGKSIELRDGKDVAIVATGSMVHYSLLAAEKLSNEGIEARVVNMHTIKPLDIETIKNAMDCKLIVSVEEHSVIGGLGSAIADYLSEQIISPPLLKIGAEDMYYKAGSYKYLLEQCGLTEDGLFEKIKKRMGELL